MTTETVTLYGVPIVTNRTVLYERETVAQGVRDRLNELTLAVDRHQGRSGYCKDQISETVARGEQALHAQDSSSAATPAAHGSPPCSSDTSRRACRSASPTSSDSSPRA